MADIEPFQIAVPDAEIKKLKDKLDVSTFPDELEGVGRSRGPPLADVKRLATYWKDGFDWRKAEARLNKLPQFKTPIQVEGFEPLSIHFVHQKSSVPEAIPLLFIHGWPGSFIEVEKLLPLLAERDGKKSPAFHVVALSLPNFGFSEGTKRGGFQVRHYAETCLKLMQKLGYDEFVTQGGDWGSHICRMIDHLYPQHCKATHLNMIFVQPPSVLRNPIVAIQHYLRPYSQWDKDAFARKAWFETEGQGYSAEQGTRPQTLGYALADSPVGLLAWIYEKLVEWTDGHPWTDDEILTWIAIYWFSTAGPAASLRIYYERRHTKEFPNGLIQGYVPNVLLGLAYFPKDLHMAPPLWGATLGPVVHKSIHKHGGHFATTEHPEIIAEDLVKMFGKGGGAFGVVRGRNGYGPVSHL